MGIPVVSVVVPAYNAEPYLHEALRSVVDQTYPSIECIVVDDGSTDRTREIASLWDVRLISQRRTGVSSARNRGVAESSGDLVAFLDADDVWLPSKLERQVGDHLQLDVDLSYTGLRVVDSSLNPIEDIYPPSSSTALRNTALNERPVLSVSQTGLVTRDLFDRLGGFDTRMSRGEDADFACRAALEGAISPLHEILVLYRLHKDQAHLDPSSMVQDTELMFEKLWGDPSLPIDVRRSLRRARANVQISVAAGFLHNRDLRSFWTHVCHATRLRPDRVANAAGKLLTIRTRRLMRRSLTG